MTRRRAGQLWLATAVVTAALSIYGRRLQRWVAASASVDDRAWLVGAVLAAVLVLALVWVARREGRRALVHLAWMAPLFAFVPWLLPVVEERVHFAVFGWLGFLTLLRFEPGAGFPTCLAIAALDEGLQAFVPDRVADLRDVGVNAAAALIGGLVATRTRSRTR